jgi:hypothetical protein
MYLLSSSLQVQHNCLEKHVRLCMLNVSEFVDRFKVTSA